MAQQIRDLKTHAQAGCLSLLQALHPQYRCQGVLDLVQHDLEIFQRFAKQISFQIVLGLPGNAGCLQVGLESQRKHSRGGIAPVSAKIGAALIVNHLCDRVGKAA